MKMSRSNREKKMADGDLRAGVDQTRASVNMMLVRRKCHRSPWMKLRLRRKTFFSRGAGILSVVQSSDGRSMLSQAGALNKLDACGEIGRRSGHAPSFATMTFWIA